jgi:hypothetical protein
MHLIYHIGDGDGPAPTLNCTNGINPPAPLPAAAAAAAAAGADTHANSPKSVAESDTPVVYSKQPYLSASKSLDGPFETVEIKLPAGHTTVSWGNDNPAPFVFDNGTVLMLTRKYNHTRAIKHIVPHDTIWVVRAASYLGPYELLGEFVPHENFNEEDPVSFLAFSCLLNSM